MLFVALGVGGYVLSKFAYLPKKDQFELVKHVLAVIGLFTVLNWGSASSSRPYCEDMNKIATEVRSLDEAVGLFSDGKTDWEEAVSKTEMRIGDLRKLVERCQCPD